MRPMTLLFSLAAACAAAVPAVAQQATALPAQQAVPASPIGDEAKEALSQVQVRGQSRRYRLDPDEARQVRGTYALSNGWTMRVTSRLSHVNISINDGPDIELLAQSGDKFASADGKIATVFNLGPWQEDVVMSYVPDARLSDQRVIVGSGTLAAR